MQESLRQQYLQAMGIQLWESRIPALDELEEAQTEMSQVDDVHQPVPAQEPDTRTEQPASPEAELKQESGQPVSKPVIDWDELKKQVDSCTLCGLHEGRIYPVLGTGDRNATVMVVGEAPGADEDRQGEPFVGQAGQLFDKILTAVGLRREQVYITNIIKCRPPGNRDPHVDEISHCMPYLQQQIQAVNPDIIIAVGRIAAHSLLNTDAPLSRLRGSLQAIDGLDTPLIVTYHPAYLLRKPSEKRKVWQDMQLLMGFLNRKN